MNPTLLAFIRNWEAMHSFAELTVTPNYQAVNQRGDNCKRLTLQTPSFERRLFHCGIPKILSVCRLKLHRRACIKQKKEHNTVIYTTKR
jgi:hypothetical protein